MGTVFYYECWCPFYNSKMNHKNIRKGNHQLFRNVVRFKNYPMELIWGRGFNLLNVKVAICTLYLTFKSLRQQWKIVICYFIHFCKLFLPPSFLRHLLLNSVGHSFPNGLIYAWMVEINRNSCERYFWWNNTCRISSNHFSALAYVFYMVILQVNFSLIMLRCFILIKNSLC